MDTVKMNQNKKTRVLVVGERKRIVYRRFSSILSKESAVKELFVLPNLDNPPFFILRWFSLIKRFREVLKTFKPNKVIICGDALISMWIIVFLVKLFQLPIEIILFRYDIEHLRPFPKEFKVRFGHFVALRLEKFCFLKADKIIHKGLENELEFLPFYKKIKDKPHYLFREFLEPNLIQKYDPKKKLSAKDGEIHLVYVGSFYLENLPYADSIWEFYPKMTRQKLHLHIYSKVDKKTENKLKEIGSKNSYFHYEGHRAHDSLIKEISKYDYGSYLHVHNRAKIKANYLLMFGFGNKVFDYFSAHIPFICSDDATAIVKFIDKYSVGLHIDYKKINVLKEKLEYNKKKYVKMIKNIEKATPELLNKKNFVKFVNS